MTSEPLKVELVGGPFDGETVSVHPDMNSMFYMRRIADEQRSWYQYRGETGKAYHKYEGP